MRRETRNLGRRSTRVEKQGREIGVQIVTLVSWQLGVVVLDRALVVRGRQLLAITHQSFAGKITLAHGWNIDSTNARNRK